MPAPVHQLPDAHTDDVLDYGFSFAGFGTGDDVATFAVTVPSGVTAGTPSASGQTVTVRLGPADAGTHRIICTATSDAGQEATIEADWTVSDPD
jgi:hypothetical protein